MGNFLAKRGVFQSAETATDTGTTLSERLQSVVRRIQDRPGDYPVVVSAGFLRWVADASKETTATADAADLYKQIEKLTRERDEARESVVQIKAHSDRISEQLQLSNVRVAALTERVAKLREALSVMTGKPATSSNK